MPTEPRKMGDEGTGTVKPREMGNKVLTVRNCGAELIRNIIENNDRILLNQVNDEEQIEAIVAQANSDLFKLLRALETVGATTDPITELDNRVNQIKGILTFAGA